MISDKRQDPIAHDNDFTVPSPMVGKRKTDKRKRGRDELSLRTGRCLFIARRLLGLTQNEVAGICGVSQPAYVAYENGQHLLDPHEANTLFEKLGLPLTWLYRGAHVDLPGKVKDNLPQNWRDMVEDDAPPGWREKYFPEKRKPRTPKGK